ncbi:MAG: cupin domain-containing protein [Anaerolineaceae bacterium]|nr:cupin domain-containing protein [Anaerolineaceae bacterium]
MSVWNNPLSKAEEEQMHPDALAILKHFQLERLPVEGTLYKNTYVSENKNPDGTPIGTAMIGMYTETPFSASCFHCLKYDEIWHVYGGDPFNLILLYPDGSSKEVLMGSNPLNGEHIQFVVPAKVWQAGSLNPGGRYALFGCSMAPGFSGAIFEAADQQKLIHQYPQHKDDILRLNLVAGETHMPNDFTQ